MNIDEMELRIRDGVEDSEDLRCLLSAARERDRLRDELGSAQMALVEYGEWKAVWDKERDRMRDSLHKIGSALFEPAELPSGFPDLTTRILWAIEALHREIDGYKTADHNEAALQVEIDRLRDELGSAQMALVEWAEWKAVWNRQMERLRSIPLQLLSVCVHKPEQGEHGVCYNQGALAAARKAWEIVQEVSK